MFEINSQLCFRLPLEVRYQKGAKYTLNGLEFSESGTACESATCDGLHTNCVSLCPVTTACSKATYKVYSYEKQRRSLSY